MTRLLVGTEDGLFELDGSTERKLPGRVTAVTGEWAIVDRSTVVQRTADGEWRPWLTFDPPGSMRLTCLTRTDDVAIIGSSTGQLLRHDARSDAPSPHLHAVEGFDHVEGRDDWHAVGSRSPYVRSLTATAGGVLLANVHVGGIPRSTDGGETWQPTIEVDADVHEVRAHPDRPELVLAAAAVGVCRSDDAGATWTVLHEGLHGTYCRAVAFTDDSALVSASTGPFTDRAAVYRLPLDRRGPLERTSEWFPHNIDTGCLDGAGRTAAFGGRDGTVYVSGDAGRAWAVAAEGLPPVTAVALPADER